MHQAVDGIEFAAHVMVAGDVHEVVDCWVVRVTAEDMLCFSFSENGISINARQSTFLCSLVWLVDIVDGQDGEVTVISKVTERDTSTGLNVQVVDNVFSDVQTDGHAE